MTDIELPVVDDKLKNHAEWDGSRLFIAFEGAAELQDPTPLDAVLSKLHSEALRLEATKVDVDLRLVEFMNSSCLKAFVTWIGRIMDEEQARRYAITFLSDANMLWQRRSLSALQSFATDLISIQS